MHQRPLLIGLVGLSGVAVALALVVGHPASPSGSSRTSASDAARAAERRPAATTQADRSGSPSSSGDAVNAARVGAGPVAAATDSVGTVQPIRADANPSAALVAEALATGTHPERLSALVQPQPFDAKAFTAATAPERAAYVDDVQPGRALQSAAPGDQVPVLSPLGSTQLTISQDATAYLRVRTVANFPATFTTFDLGHFQNRLTSQTVLADADGVASVAYTPGPGTIDAVHVLAASPVASGQVLFDILVTDPVTAQATRPAGN